MSQEKSAPPRLTGIPAKRSTAVVLKARLYLILALVVLCALAGVFSGLAWITAKPEAPDLTSVEPVARGEAEKVAYAWLNGEKVPVGTAGGVQSQLTQTSAVNNEPKKTIDYKTVTWMSFDKEELIDETPYEIHNFLVTSNVPQKGEETLSALYTLSVTMLITNQEPVLAAEPSIEPYIPSSSDFMFDYSTVAETVSLPAAATERIQQWATAYATNDKPQLSILVGDPEEGVYDGIDGFTSAEANVVNSVSFSEDGNQVLVRARVALTSANGVVIQTQYDLLVTGANSNAPNIVAWGPAGSGNRTDFVPYLFNRRPL